MTRESKLALILSFVLILVVGVLVSDHFSQASSMEPDRLGDASRQPIAQLPGVERSRIDNAIDRVLQPKPQQFAQQQPTMAQPEVQTQPDPVVIANGSNRGGSLLDELSNGLSKSIDDLRAPALASPLSHEPVNPVSRPLGAVEHATYRVQEGDSLYQIAARMLGDGNRWGEIQRLNASLIGPSGIINPGMELKLPTGARVSAPVATGVQPTKTESGTIGKLRSYKVASGDTLGEISFKLLGTSRRMGEIVTLNGLADADDIRVGMTLKIPAK